MKTFPKRAPSGPVEKRAARDSRLTRMIMEEISATGIAADRFLEACQTFGKRSQNRVLASLPLTFSSEQRRELQALFEWPGSRVDCDPHRTPSPPQLSDSTCLGLLKGAEREGFAGEACLMLLYMDARARAFRRLMVRNSSSYTQRGCS
ncbi:MAG: hypothetical protein M3P24_07940 [Gemmatimonadota bacterium]|nr:hypothetical protein [Gemmatimonadota bacterium]